MDVRGHARRWSVVTATACVAALMLATPSPAAEPTLYASSPATGTTSGWTPSSNAWLATVNDGGQALTVTPSSSSGTKTITATTTSAPIGPAGTRVHSAAQLKLTQSGKAVTMTLTELSSAGSPLATHTGRLTSNGSFQWTGSEIVTTAANSRIRVTFEAVDVTASNVLSIRSVNETITPGTTAALYNNPYLNDANGWNPSANSSVTTVNDGGRALTVTPNSSTGTKTISVTTTSYGIGPAGTRVHSAAQLKLTQSGKAVNMTLTELSSDGSPLATHTGRLTSNGSYQWTGSEIVTTHPNSRIRVTFEAVDVTGSNVLSVRNLQETITPGSGGTGPGNPPADPPPGDLQLYGNRTFATNLNGWTPNSSSRLERENEGGSAGYALEINPNSSSGTKTLAASTFTSSVMPAHMIVKSTARVQTTQPNVEITLTLAEINPNGVQINEHIGRIRPTNTNYVWTGAEVKTVKPGSRIRVTFEATGMTGSNTIRINQISETLTQGDPPPVVTGPCTGVDMSKADQGTLAWSDEFTGSSVNASRWNVRNNTSLSMDAAYLRAANVSVSNGMLNITAKRESAGGRQFTSGYLDTMGKFSQRYGRWEMRAKLPTTAGDSRGLWPAFWLRGDSVDGEIDIMEAYGEPTVRDDYREGSYTWSLHEDTNHTGEWMVGWGTERGDDRLSDDFHVYAVDWTPNCMVFSLDGKAVAELVINDHPWLRGSTFQGPFNIRLNLAVGFEYWGFPDPAHPEWTVLPKSLQVDYVRVYKPL